MTQMESLKKAVLSRLRHMYGQNHTLLPTARNGLKSGTMPAYATRLPAHTSYVLPQTPDTLSHLSALLRTHKAPSPDLLCALFHHQSCCVIPGLACTLRATQVCCPVHAKAGAAEQINMSTYCAPPLPMHQHCAPNTGLHRSCQGRPETCNSQVC